MGLPELKNKILLQIENADENFLTIVSNFIDNCKKDDSLLREAIEKAKLQAIEDEVKRLKEEQEANEQAEQRAKDALIAEAEREAAENLAKIEAKKPKMFEGAISKGLEVDAEVIHSQRPNKVKIYVKGYEDKLFDMTESAPQPKGYICRVSLVIEKGRILRVIHKIPK